MWLKSINYNFTGVQATGVIIVYCDSAVSYDPKIIGPHSSSKFVGCKIGSMRSRLVLIIRGVHSCNDITQNRRFPEFEYILHTSIHSIIRNSHVQLLLFVWKSWKVSVFHSRSSESAVFDKNTCLFLFSRCLYLLVEVFVKATNGLVMNVEEDRRCMSRICESRFLSR